MSGRRLDAKGSFEKPVDAFPLSVWACAASVHLVDVWNMIEAFRDNGLNTLEHHAEINVSRLETILSSIYYQLNKRLPTTHQINVEQSIGLLLNFMVATYDRCDLPYITDFFLTPPPQKKKKITFTALS